MKKLIRFLLIFVLMISVCGCLNNDDDVRGEYENNSSNNSGDEKITEEEFSLGTVAGNVYKNDFIGIGYNLDEGWSFYSDEKIKELNQIVIEMSNDEVEEMLKNANIVYDMVAVDSKQLNNVNINLEKGNNIKFLTLDLAENFKAAAPIIKENLKNMGYENINYEIVKVDVDGKMLDAMHITAEINGINMYQTSFQKKCNGYLASVTVTTYFDDTISDLIDNFYWLD